MIRRPNPICKCGHRRDRHSYPRLPSTVCDVRKCDCRRFVRRPSKHRVLLDATDYDALVKKQGSETCAICGAKPGKRRLHKDHDHRGMYVRGLLCPRCNLRLDDRVTPRWLRDAAMYLERAETERGVMVGQKVDAQEVLREMREGVA